MLAFIFGETLIVVGSVVSVTNNCAAYGSKLRCLRQQIGYYTRSDPGKPAPLRW